MRLISSKKAKRNISLTFVLALMLSNLLSLVGPQAQAAVTVTSSTAGTCLQHTGTVANGSTVTVYDVGTIQISLTAAEITAAGDAADNDATGAPQATLAGSISTNSDVIGNVFSLTPPTGTNFVILPGAQSTSAGASNKLSSSNISISNAFSDEGGTAYSLGIDGGVVTAGTAGIGRFIVAIAKDGTDTYPQSGTGTNTVTISIMGLGLAVPPSGDGSLSGTLAATFDSTPPSGIGLSGGTGTPAVASAIPGLSGTINICTVASPAGKLEAISDNDDDATENYDKSGTASVNLIALGQVSTNTRVWSFDTGSLAAGVSGTSLVDLEPIIIRSKTGFDQVFQTGELLSDIDTAGEVPSTTQLDLTATFGNSATTPITVAFADDNASATTTLKAVDIIIQNSTAGSSPAVAGHSGTHSSRFGALGSLRAALLDATSDATTNTSFGSGITWGLVSVSGGTDSLQIQESVAASAGGSALGSYTGITGNSTEPFRPGFLDLRLNCDASTVPVAGWFAIANSTTAGSFGTGLTNATDQKVKATQTGNKFVVNSSTTLYNQALTQIAGSNPVVSTAFGITAFGMAALTTSVAGNALLYAACSNNTLTLFPVAQGFDAQRDVIAVTPLLEVTNVSNTFSSDVNLIAQVSGNNLTGTTQLNLSKLVGVPTTGGMSTLASAQGVAVAENAQLAVKCGTENTSVVLSSISTGSVATSVSAAGTGCAIEEPAAIFAGGAADTVSGSTVITGSPAVQSNGRGVLITEASATGFNELVNQIGGGVTGTLFEVSLPSGCDVIDDLNDPVTAAATNAGGNDVSRPTLTSTAGVTAVFVGGSGDAAIASSDVLVPAAGTTPAKVRFRLSSVGSTTDIATTDSVLLRFDAQDIFCPSTTTGSLTGSVRAQNKVNTPTLTTDLGSSVKFGTATKAFEVGIADDVTSSTLGASSTNTNIGATPRLVGGSTCTSNPFELTELDNTSIPIGGRASARLLDPDNSVISTVLSTGEIWVVPNDPSAFSTAPAADDISFSDDSLTTNGTPTIATSATVHANAPLGTLVIPIKRNTSGGNPAENKTTVTIRDLKLTAATASTADLIASIEFFNPDAGVIVNTGGIVAANSATAPTVFTPYSASSTKAATQLNVIAASAVQLGATTTAATLATNRLTTLGTPQISPFASPVTSVSAADSTKITTAATKPDAASTDNVITVTGAAGSVTAGSDVTVANGTYDSVTVKASSDGSFTAAVKGDCSSASSVSTTITPAICGTSGTAASKTTLCTDATTTTPEDVKDDLDGDDNVASVQEVIDYINANGGLAAIISGDTNVLQGIILALKEALGIS